MSDVKLFDTLASADANAFDYYASLSSSEQKSVSQYMMLRMMGCSNDAVKLERLNATANQWFVGLGAYPELLYHILTVCGGGSREFYKWRNPKVPVQKRPVTVRLLKEYYNDSTLTAVEDSIMMDLSSMIEIAEVLGNIDDIKLLRREYQ